ncbi:unnamed protein product [Rotaria socialis]|uniref:Uncharacterized protein n=1 Tax=Rotaria socialis TaxID=392032 RepID=A0A818LDM3_9BILA|nr:unnamed protein product [Rotaria socialis]CAF4231399.1 unnamed protein product [Rotaria socialis]
MPDLAELALVGAAAAFGAYELYHHHKYGNFGFGNPYNNSSGYTGYGNQYGYDSEYGYGNPSGYGSEYGYGQTGYGHHHHHHHHML